MSRTHVVTHGTVNEYVNFRCRCQPCRDAATHYMGALRARRAAQHGKCIVDGCDNNQEHGNGYCHPHHERQRKGMPLVPVHKRPGARIYQPIERPHGVGKYKIDGCRCDVCVQAIRAVWRERNWRKRGKRP